MLPLLSLTPLRKNFFHKSVSSFSPKRPLRGGIEMWLLDKHYRNG
ncbi:hypothetical protein PORCRE_1432 [Porphyromonas crevioricanis JCM 15906]|uniref:Uncharacterized protein n=1 Tax=Porphyromonas crevioricanis JCM 15906 TaxID=1305617 RepID=T1DSI5_9PORP|nr:hypothetical protein PORCRE_1432 [Porphyromonas crevioricanis JCM 15906]